MKLHAPSTVLALFAATGLAIAALPGNAQSTDPAVEFEDLMSDALTVLEPSRILDSEQEQIASLADQWVDSAVMVEQMALSQTSGLLAPGVDSVDEALEEADHDLSGLVMREMASVGSVAETSTSQLVRGAEPLLSSEAGELILEQGQTAGNVGVPELVSINDGNGTLIGNANNQSPTDQSDQSMEERTRDGLVSINEGNGTLIGVANNSTGGSVSGGGSSGGNGGFLFSQGGAAGDSN